MHFFLDILFFVLIASSFYFFDDLTGKLLKLIELTNFTVINGLLDKRWVCYYKTKMAIVTINNNPHFRLSSQHPTTHSI